MRLLALLAVLLAGPVMAHDGVVHATPEEAKAHKAQTGAAVGAPTPGLPFPVDIDARFNLIDQDGRAVSQADFAGKAMAIFFGYANCEAICSVALPRLGQALDLLEGEADKLCVASMRSQLMASLFMFGSCCRTNANSEVRQRKT